MNILIYGQPKSGTTALLFAVEEALKKTYPNSAYTTVFEPTDVLNLAEGQEIAKTGKPNVRLGKNTLIKALVQNNKGDGLSFEAAKRLKADKKILLVRDPRDRWISSFFYQWFRRSVSDKVAFEDALLLAEFKECHPHLLPMYTLQFRDREEQDLFAVRQREQLAAFVTMYQEAVALGWHICRYEEFVAGNFKSLNAYLGGLDVQTVEVTGPFARVARSKTSGEWRTWFTKEDVSFFKDVYRNPLAALGYDATDWALTNPTTISGHLGSEYMRSLAKQKQNLVAPNKHWLFKRLFTR